jgi:FMN-dependent NADH-azoreductase
MKLLHVDSSILGPGSVSRQLSAEIVAAKQRLHSGLEVVYRDLAVEPVGHLSGAHLAAAQGTVPEAEPLRHDVAAGQAALEELLAADIVVVGAPMYTLPSRATSRPGSTGWRSQARPFATRKRALKVSLAARK